MALKRTVPIIVLILAFALRSPGVNAQDVAPPPALGPAVVTSPLTSEEIFSALSCPTGLTSVLPSPDGLRLTVGGRCRPGEDWAGVTPSTSAVTFPDGEVQIKVKVTAGIERALLAVDVRLQTGGWYRLSWLPASGEAYLATYPQGRETVLARRNDIPRDQDLGKVHTLALRAQGSRLWGLIDDRPVLMATDAAFSVGGIGLDLLRMGSVDDTEPVSAIVQELRVSPIAGSPQDRLPTVRGATPVTAPAANPVPAAAPAASPAPSAGVAPQPTVARSIATGSCGPARGQYGYTGISASMFGYGARTVPAVYFKVDYALQYPTTLALLFRYNDEIGGIEFISDSWPAAGLQGSYEGDVRAEIRPERQGAGDGVIIGSGRFDGPANSQWTSRLQSDYAGQGGLRPGGYFFYVYMGEWRLEQGTWKFHPDVTGPIGKFGCDVADDEAKK